VVNVKIKKKILLSIKVVTDDEHVHDNKALPELVNGILKSNDNKTAIGKLFADDGAYDGNDF
jgi:hypothetical protein